MKNRSGITLIALIVTILVLIILAGITLGFVVGDNGILSKSKDAKDKSSYSQNVENSTLIGYANIMNDTIDGSTRGTQEQISSIITNIDFSTSNITDSTMTITITPTVSTTESDVMGYHIICVKSGDASSVVSKMSESKTVNITRISWKFKLYNICNWI